MDKWIYPFFEGYLLADVNNMAMKGFVDHTSKLSAATIRDYSNIVKAVVASAIDEKGDSHEPEARIPSQSFRPNSICIRDLEDPTGQLGQLIQFRKTG